MLLLDRKQGESIYIGDDITVKIVAMNSHVVAVGVQAPKSIGVHREEVYRRIQTDKQEKSSMRDHVTPKQRIKKDSLLSRCSRQWSHRQKKSARKLVDIIQK